MPGVDLRAFLRLLGCQAGRGKAHCQAVRFTLGSGQCSLDWGKGYAVE